jgi:hypothetical protein
MNQSEKSPNMSSPLTFKEISLGLDPARGEKFMENEMKAAIKLEGQIGRTIKRSTLNEGGDWIDNNGKIYDLVGPVPAQHVDKQLKNFIEQIKIHDRKSIDIIVLDLSHFQPEQILKIREVFKNLKKEVIILETKGK